MTGPRRDLRALAAVLSDPAIAGISVDVFDTLLLRGLQPELSRLIGISHAQHRALVALDTPSPGGQVLARERLRVHKAAYDRVWADPTLGEVRHHDILAALCAGTGLPETLIPVLANAETAWEERRLRANRPLAAVLLARRADRPLVLTSDMYLEEPALRRLLARLPPFLAEAPLLLSCEAGASKRRGDLYPLLASRMGLSPPTILHIGDDPASDLAAAAAAGCATFHLPRPGWLLAVRRLWERPIRRRLARAAAEAARTKAEAGDD